MKNKNQQKDKHPERNSSWQGVDKAPGEEKGKKEKLKMTDLKGKKVDGDPELESDQPVRQKSDDNGE
jgi:hypothetical protein